MAFIILASEILQMRVLDIRQYYVSSAAEIQLYNQWPITFKIM